MLLLHHPKRTIYFGGGIFAFFFLIAIGGIVFGTSRERWVLAGFMSVFMLIASPMLLAYFRNRHELTDSGIVYGSTFGRGGQFRWSDVSKVHYDAMHKRVRIESRTGDVAKIPIMLVGTPQFAHMVLHRVPPESIDPIARKALKWLVLGEVPPM
jgi:hypothetical protein